MKLIESKQGDVTVLEAQGKLDAMSAPAFDQQLAALVEGGARCVVLDLSGLDYVSSAGLRVFLSAAKRLQQAHGKLTLANPTDQVQQIFDIAGFAAILPIFKSVADAVSACAP